MALRNITEATMFSQLVYWLGRQRPLIEDTPEVAWMLPRIQALHDDFITHRRDPQARLDEAREASHAQDKLYDDDLRAGYYALLALELRARDASEKAAFRHARETIFNGGLAMVNRGYADEAAEGELVESRMDAETRALLLRNRFGDDTLAGHIERWRHEARRLGDLDATRTEVEAEVKELSGSAYRALRAEWMRVVKALQASLALVDPVVRRRLLARLDEAERRADARTAARRATGRVEAPLDEVMPEDGSDGRADADPDADLFVDGVDGSDPAADGAPDAPAVVDERPLAPRVIPVPGRDAEGDIG